MPSLRSTVPSPNEKFRAEPYRLIQAGPKVGKNPRKREPNDSHHKPTSNSCNDSSHLDNDLCLSSFSSFLLSLNSSSFHLTFPFSLLDFDCAPIPPFISPHLCRHPVHWRCVSSQSNGFRWQHHSCFPHRRPMMREKPKFCDIYTCVMYSVKLW